MSRITGIERISRQLNHLPVDHIAAAEEFWTQTIEKWKASGKLSPGEYEMDHFDLDLDLFWAFDYTLHPGEKDEILEEDEDTKLIRNANHATLRVYKTHASTPEHVAFDIVEREDWNARAREFLAPDRKRINFEVYQRKKEASARRNRFFCLSGVPVFECMHPICGHENLLIGMVSDPEWIRDMAQTYADLNIHLMEILFAEAGKPDGLWLYEDMGFRAHPFMSPEMYRELIQPFHRRVIDFAHGQGLKVIMHSCGFVEPLLPDMIEAGIDCLEAMEVKAGMDLLRIYQNFGEKIALMGGLDVRPVGQNDRNGIRRELESKIPFVKGRNGFILHSDHSIPESAEYDSYCYFLELGRELGKY